MMSRLCRCCKTAVPENQFFCPCCNMLYTEALDEEGEKQLQEDALLWRRGILLECLFFYSRILTHLATAAAKLTSENEVLSTELEKQVENDDFDALTTMVISIGRNQNLSSDLAAVVEQCSESYKRFADLSKTMISNILVSEVVDLIPEFYNGMKNMRNTIKQSFTDADREDLWNQIQAQLEEEARSTVNTVLTPKD